VALTFGSAWESLQRPIVPSPGPGDVRVSAEADVADADADADANGGLTSSEVAARVQGGQTNRVDDRTSRTYGQILRRNTFTRFNAVIAVLAIVILVVGDPRDALFAGLMVLNTAIGIIQEIRAKRTLDALTILTAPTVTVRRAGKEAKLAAEDLVVDDIVILSAGDQVPVDAVVIDASGLEVDESALTGEANAVPKAAGDEVLSGSAVVAGGASARAVRVGTKTWIHALVSQAKEFTLTQSELRTGIDRILRSVTWALTPLAALLLWSQLRANSGVADALVSAVAGVVGLVPQGLVLLVSMAMAVAIGRLGRNHVVVQELYAVEGLARIDVLCVDKTGTLTTGQFALEGTEPFTPCTDGQLRDALAALAAAEPSPTGTMAILSKSLGAAPDWTVAAQVAFSSARKWSGTTFADHGTWIMGAPEILLDAIGGAPAEAPNERVAALAADAKRVLLVAHSSGNFSADEQLPDDLTPMGLVVLAEQVRPDASDTMAYFANQQVVVKVISGDNPTTVSAIAKRLNIANADQFVDMREVTGPIDDLVAQTTVFGRVLPEQKRDLVEALQRAGHVVAMTGDGVNDIPALKKADIGIAMDTATQATKAVAQVVLLDGRFDRLPTVVAEGRRVIANMERVSSLFVTKTVYAVVFALVIGLSGSIFPFLPRHMSLVSELTIGIPAFVLSFRSSDAPSRSGYLKRVLRFALPAGLAAAIVTLASYWLASSPIIDASLAQSRTVSTLALISVGFWILYRLMRPIDRFDRALLSALAALFIGVLATPFTRRFYALSFPPIADALLTAGLTIGCIAALESILQWVDRRSGTANE
jgi:cation-transporting P-type ATPase E